MNEINLMFGGQVAVGSGTMLDKDGKKIEYVSLKPLKKAFKIGASVSDEFSSMSDKLVVMNFSKAESIDYLISVLNDCKKRIKVKPSKKKGKR